MGLIFLLLLIIFIILKKTGKLKWSWGKIIGVPFIITLALTLISQIAEGSHNTNNSNTNIPISSKSTSNQWSPTKVGQCDKTVVTKIAGRISDSPDDSGTSIIFDNGISLVSYDLVTQVVDSKIGDEIQVCLKSIPTNCPKGEEIMGSEYTVTNIRTSENFSMANSSHLCGGA